MIRDLSFNDYHVLVANTKHTYITTDSFSKNKDLYSIIIAMTRIVTMNSMIVHKVMCV